MFSVYSVYLLIASIIKHLHLSTADIDTETDTETDYLCYGIQTAIKGIYL